MPTLYRRSPVDFCGYPYKCCHCIPLKAATILICIFSFLWVIVELRQSEAYMNSVFEGYDDLVRTIAWTSHLFVVMLFLVACGILMLGIILQRSIPIHIYVWTAFIFNCICIVLTIIAVILNVINSGKFPKKKIMRVVMAMLWYSMYFYFICVVNSYKARIVTDYHLYFT